MTVDVICMFGMYSHVPTTMHRTCGTVHLFYNAMNMKLEGNGNLPDNFTLSAIKLTFHKRKCSNCLHWKCHTSSEGCVFLFEV